MKKSFLLIALFALMFLGLGSYTFGLCFSDADCIAVKGICNKSNGQCIPGTSNNNYSPGTVNAGGSCTNTLDCKGGLICFNGKCMTDPSIATNDCSNCRKLVTPTEIAAGCNGSTEQKSCSDGTYCCPKAAGTPCTITTSNLFNKSNAIINASALGCTCKDGYKEIGNECKSCSAKGVCCGIQLNTSVPFIGKCIESEKTNRGAGETNVTGETAFPVLMGSMTKILVTAILIVSFVLILIGGIMIATGNPEGGKKMIIKVVIGIALLGASGVILRLINPNFFG